MLRALDNNQGVQCWETAQAAWSGMQDTLEEDGAEDVVIRYAGVRGDPAAPEGWNREKFRFYADYPNSLFPCAVPGTGWDPVFYKVAIWMLSATLKTPDKDPDGLKWMYDFSDFTMLPSAQATADSVHLIFQILLRESSWLKSERAIGTGGHIGEIARLTRPIRSITSAALQLGLNFSECFEEPTLTSPVVQPVAEEKGAESQDKEKNDKAKLTAIHFFHFSELTDAQNEKAVIAMRITTNPRSQIHTVAEAFMEFVDSVKSEENSPGKK